MNSSKEIRQTLVLVWPLLIGLFMIMAGNGLQGTLLSLRADLEGFSLVTIGMVMSLYYCGFAAGWFIVPRMLKSVGHIRVFAGFASLASTTILLHGIFPDPWLWGAIRIVSGLSFIGLFIVSESWLNDIAPNRLRGRIFASYLFVIHAGLFLGQFLINIAPISNISLFILVSVLLSLSIMPITLANKPSPGYQEPETLPFKAIFNISPLSVAAVIVCGFCSSTVLALGPIYGQKIGLSTAEIALFIALYILGCGTLPFLFGWMSDRIDRRNIIIAISFLGFLASVFITMVPAVFMVMVYLFGGFVTSLYSTAVSAMNDRLKPEQITSATASLILSNGMSACAGPILLGALMQTFGTDIFFATLGGAFFLLLLYGTWRAFRGPKIKLEDQGEFVLMPTRSAPSALQIGEDS